MGKDSPHHGPLSDTTAIVTGGAGGIGTAISIELATAGSKVIIGQRSTERPPQVVNRITDLGGEADFVKADLSEQSDITHLVNETISRYGKVNILVNNAVHPGKEWAANFSREKWDETMAVNLAAPFFLAQASLDSMREDQFGRVINIGAIQSYSPLKGSVAYAAAKAGLEGLTRSMAVEWSDDPDVDFTANTVHVGPVFHDTENWRQSADPIEVADADVGDTDDPLTLVGRWGRPADIAGVVRFLASPASGFVTGQAFACDGGRLISRKPGPDSQM